MSYDHTRTETAKRESAYRKRIRRDRAIERRFEDRSFRRLTTYPGTA